VGKSRAQVSKHATQFFQAGHSPLSGDWLTEHAVQIEPGSGQNPCLSGKLQGISGIWPGRGTFSGNKAPQLLAFLENPLKNNGELFRDNREAFF
jgi:hypothetical protein